MLVVVEDVEQLVCRPCPRVPAGRDLSENAPLFEAVQRESHGLGGAANRGISRSDAEDRLAGKQLDQLGPGRALTRRAGTGPPLFEEGGETYRKLL